MDSNKDFGKLSSYTKCRLSINNFENGNLDFNCVGILCVGNNYISMLKLLIARLSD